MVYDRGLFFVNQVVTALFAADLLLQFFVAIILPDGTIITSHVILAKLYLQSWFWVDLIATIPFDAVVQVVSIVGLFSVSRSLIDPAFIYRQHLALRMPVCACFVC
jgi:hypothetical protein